jgi:hypothetical protein
VFIDKIVADRLKIKYLFYLGVYKEDSMNNLIAISNDLKEYTTEYDFLSFVQT